VARAGPPCAAKTQNPFMVAHVTGEIMAWLQRNFLCSPLLLIHLVFVHNWKKKKKNQCGDPQRCISVCTQFVSLYYSVVRK